MQSNHIQKLVSEQRSHRRRGTCKSNSVPSRYKQHNHKMPVQRHDPWPHPSQQYNYMQMNHKIIPAFQPGMLLAPPSSFLQPPRYSYYPTNNRMNVMPTKLPTNNNISNSRPTHHVPADFKSSSSESMVSSNGCTSPLINQPQNGDNRNTLAEKMSSLDLNSSFTIKEKEKSTDIFKDALPPLEDVSINAISKILFNIWRELQKGSQSPCWRCY